MTKFLSYSFSIALVALLFAPNIVLAATGTAGLPAPQGGAKAGVPLEPVWFSKDPFFAGDEITIYAPLFNSSSYRFRGSARLEDGGKVIGTQEFTLENGGGSVVVAFPWKATEGEHAFSVLIVNGEFLDTNKNFIDLPISTRTTTEIKRTAHLAPVPPAEGVSVEEAPAVQYLSSKIPAAIIADTVPILGGLEQFRVNQALRAITSVGNIQSAIASSSKMTATSSVGTVAPKEGGLVRPAERGEGGWKTLGGGIESGDFVRTPWQYVKLFFALIYQFLTTNIYAFYVFLCYVIYKIIRGLFALFF